MGRFERLPGINDENTTRRNAIVGGAYAFLGIGIIGAAVTDPDEENENGGDDGDDVDSEDSDGNDGESGSNGSEGESTDDSDDNGESDISEPERSDDPELLHLSDLGNREEPYFGFEPTTLSGTGASVTETFELQAEMVAFIYEHDGDSNFIVEGYNDATDERLAVIVNQIGAVSGATALPSQRLDVYLDVDANGPWEIIAAQPFSPEVEIREPPAQSDGQGNAVVGPIDLSGGETATGGHSGDGNFIVEFMPETAIDPIDGELVFNELDEFEGETVVTTEGVGWFDVKADGQWSLEIE